MNSKTIAAIFLFSVAVPSLEARPRGGTTETTLPWHSDIRTAVAEARETGRPILAVFR